MYCHMSTDIYNSYRILSSLSPGLIDSFGVALFEPVHEGGVCSECLVDPAFGTRFQS